MIKPAKLKIGDTIGVIAPCGPIIGKNVEEMNRARKVIENAGFKVKYSKNMFSNTNGYSSTAKEKANDINEMFLDNEVKMVWCAKGGENSNITFEYIDYNIIKENPKILCGYSDMDHITNMISEKTGLVTFSSTNFKTIATDETDYSYKEVIKRFVKEGLDLGIKDDKYTTIKSGVAEGKLVGGNLSILRTLTAGKYSINFDDKILFLEELGIETGPALASNYLYYLKQNGIFKKIKGLWIGYYEHESEISLEKIISDVIGNEYNFPIIKSNNFGHTDTKTVIPIGISAKIDTNEEIKIKLIENCLI